MFARVRKFIVAAIAAAGFTVVALSDKEVTHEEWIEIGALWGVAAAVWAVPNEPQ